MTFLNFNLSVETQKGVEELGFSQPTEIQQQVIPKVRAHHDLCGIAQTGSGKTASYVIPILDLLKASRKRSRLPRCLVLVPTRELAHQVEQSFAQLGKFHKIKQAVVIGGESPILQERKIRTSIDVVIATPGRLLDHYERGNIILHAAEIVVIDEADRMLDMGFIPDIERLMAALPKDNRQTLCFSATMAAPIKKLVDEFLNNPDYITISKQIQTAQTVSQFFIKGTDNEKQKRATLRALLTKENIKCALIFCNRKVDVSTLTRSLTHYKLNAAALHGDLKQSLRMKTLQSFKNGEIDYLVASDVAARGIDIEELPTVINFDLPYNPEEYVHRVGRTGRAGRSGKAYSFVSEGDQTDLNKIKKFIHQDIVFIDLHKVLNPLEKDKSRTEKHKKSAQPPSGNRPKSSQQPHSSPISNEPVVGFGQWVPKFIEIKFQLPGEEK